MASPSGLTWQISNILSELEKSFDNSFAYFDKSATFAILFEVPKISNYTEDKYLMINP